MARIVGVDLPRQKRVEIGLRSVFGIGSTRAKALMEKMGMDPINDGDTIILGASNKGGDAARWTGLSE